VAVGVGLEEVLVEDLGALEVGLLEVEEVAAHGKTSKSCELLVSCFKILVTLLFVRLLVF
jgi:hypothetical protein